MSEEAIKAHCLFHGIAEQAEKKLVSEFKKTGYVRAPNGAAEWGDRKAHATDVLLPGDDGGTPAKSGSKG